jgi:hypothetical protein
VPRKRLYLENAVQEGGNTSLIWFTRTPVGSDAPLNVFIVDAPAKEVKESYNVRAMMLVDPDGGVFAEYNVQYVPTLLILDRDHRIVWAHVGELDIGALESALERVLGG